MSLSIDSRLRIKQCRIYSIPGCLQSNFTSCSIVVFEKKIKKISLCISIFNFEPLGGRSIDPDVKVLTILISFIFKNRMAHLTVIQDYRCGPWTSCLKYILKVFFFCSLKTKHANYNKRLFFVYVHILL